MTWSTQGGELVRVDPRSFRPLPGPRVELGIHGYSSAYSPDRSKLVVGGFACGLRFVDLERFEHLGDLREHRRRGLVVAVAWPTPRRVLAVVQEPEWAGPLSLAVVDPVTRTVLEWRPLSLSAGTVRVAVDRLGLVLLLAPLRENRRQERVGLARLLFIDARGRARSVVLDRLWAGHEAGGLGAMGRIGRFWSPGLTLDPVRRRAFVVGGGAPVAEVDLDSKGALGGPSTKASRPASERLRVWPGYRRVQGEVSSSPASRRTRLRPDRDFYASEPSVSGSSWRLGSGRKPRPDVLSLDPPAPTE